MILVPLISSSRLARLVRTALRGAVLAALLTAGVNHAAEPVFDGPFIAGPLESPPRHEASGLAASRRASDVLWTHDDSGGEPVVYAIDTAGKKRGALRLLGVKNEDWEDIAAFQRDQKAWLLIADTGDNDAKRDTVQLHVVEEPNPERLRPNAELTAAPAYSLRIRYEDGPRDCESVAVDPVEGAVYLLTKRDAPSRLYRVPLGPSRDKIVVARLVGTAPELAGRSHMDTMIKHLVGKKFSWPTAMDFAADGRTAVVLTYGEPLLFTRRGNESWAEALKRAPTRLLFHGLPQAEAACFSADGRALYVASEGVTSLVRYDREDH